MTVLLGLKPNMTLPISPANGDIYVDPTTKRRFQYYSTGAYWVLLKRSDIKDLDDVSDTPPNAGESLAYNSTISQYSPSISAGGSFVPLVYSTLDPTENDFSPTGTIWVNNLNPTQTKAWLATTDDGVSKTHWQSVGNSESVFQRPSIQTQPVAPVNPAEGQIWFDNSGPIVKKYWYDGTWRSLVN